MSVHNLTPAEVAAMLARDEVLLVDVREPHEVAAQAIPDAINVPLSTFDAAQIPDPKGKRVVFSCRSGVRSVTASEKAQAQGYPYDSHMASGIIGWVQAGFGTEQR